MDYHITLRMLECRFESYWNYNKGNWSRGEAVDCKPIHTGSNPVFPSYVERSLMVGQKFVALYVWVRFPSFNPKESWVSGWNQQFTKLPIVKGPWVRISHFPQKYRYGGIGIRSGLRSHTIIGSNPITGTKCTFFRFFKKSQNFFEGNFLVYRENYCIFNI